MSNIAENLKFLMEEHKITNALLTSKSGLGRNAVSDIINGKSKSPRSSTLEAIAKALDCTVDLLLNEDTRRKYRLVKIEANIRTAVWEPILAQKCLNLMIEIIKDKDIDLTTQQADIVFRDIYNYTVKKALISSKDKLDLSYIEPDHERAEWIIEGTYRSDRFPY